MKEAIISYKKAMNSSYHTYHENFDNDLNVKSKSDPKNLRKYLNSIGKPQSSNKIPVGIEQFLEYFEKLNMSDEEGYYPDIDFNKVPLENINRILNSVITDEEILKVIKNLKNSKAAGYDGIVNEHIKSTVPINAYLSQTF